MEDLPSPLTSPFYCSHSYSRMVAMAFSSEAAAVKGMMGSDRDGMRG